MRFLSYLVLLGILSLVACDKPVAVELPNANKDAVRYDTKDFDGFQKLLVEIQRDFNGEPFSVEISHNGEVVELMVSPLPPEICAAAVSVKDQSILMGDAMTPVDLAGFKHTLFNFKQGGDVAGIQPGLLIFAFEGADMATGNSVMRAMSITGVHLWLALPGENKGPEPPGKKPSSPTSDDSRILKIDPPDEGP